MSIGWWLAIALVLVIIEVLTVDLVFLMLAIGTLAAALAGYLGGGFAVQVAALAVVSTALLFLVRPAIKRHLTAGGVETNALGLVGETGTLTRPIGQAPGLVRLPGGEWTARTPDDAPLAQGTTVRVVAIDGATALVVHEPTD
ncbi:NfeD family protein [Actinomyces sp. B33]|uniref:NfeD family protein n=1 Tax=Actinomyces sp. B33 TaxID=2942131 RepID=UPI0023410BCC|nr:NfeD family protein [Actinomyces sp. B33]MDC4233213.1 NfeD family protein [Actinomyces sp. B33]